MKPSYKSEVIRVNISSTFMQRSRCIKCLSGPDFYYAVMNPIAWKNVAYFLVASEISKKWVKRMNSDWYQSYQPRYFNKLGDFTFILEDKSFLPLLHRIRGAAVGHNSNVVEFLSCECGDTVWAFNSKSVKNRPEITNRKGRYKYPQRFAY